MPFSYSQACSTFRIVLAETAATRTDLGGMDFFAHRACVIAFYSAVQMQPNNQKQGKLTLSTLSIPAMNDGFFAQGSDKIADEKQRCYLPARFQLQNCNDRYVLEK
jgi:hypothetical protein